MIRWRIWYSDGSTYDNTQGSWRDAPIYGVVIVAVRDPTGQKGTFYYSGMYPASTENLGNWCFVKKPGCEPWATDKFGLIQLLGVEGMSPLDVKLGEMVSQERWHEIHDIATADPDFPKGWIRRRFTDPHP